MMHMPAYELSPKSGIRLKSLTERNDVWDTFDHILFLRIDSLILGHWVLVQHDLKRAGSAFEESVHRSGHGVVSFTLKIPAT